MSVEEPASTHWNDYAARWNLVGEPLRPSATDIRYLRDSVTRLLPAHDEPDLALLLGVTPEIAAIEWPRPLKLLAVDKSPGMVSAVWPGDTATRLARVGNWLSLDTPDAAFGLVMGDGVFSILDYPNGYARLAGELARVLRPGGLLSLRLFCRPEPCETVDAVYQDLHAGRIGNFHVFKWRLAMALQGEGTHGVKLADIWQTFATRVPSIAELSARQAWPEPQVANIHSYRGVSERYTFSTEREVIDGLAPSFELLEIWRPSYELGERCPHVSLRRRA
jgi:SAM-dependent methyltransferase